MINLENIGNGVVAIIIIISQFVLPCTLIHFTNYRPLTFFFLWLLLRLRLPLALVAIVVIMRMYSMFIVNWLFHWSGLCAIYAWMNSIIHQKFSFAHRFVHTQRYSTVFIKLEYKIITFVSIWCPVPNPKRVSAAWKKYGFCVEWWISRNWAHVSECVCVYFFFFQIAINRRKGQLCFTYNFACCQPNNTEGIKRANSKFVWNALIFNRNIVFSFYGRAHSVFFCSAVAAAASSHSIPGIQKCTAKNVRVWGIIHTHIVEVNTQEKKCSDRCGKTPEILYNERQQQQQQQQWRME